jgi:hemerythrin
MNIIAWSSEFALGVDEIDQQHQALVGMINALDASTRDDSSSDTVRQLLRDLNDYVREHFAFEERLMAA